MRDRSDTQQLSFIVDETPAVLTVSPLPTLGPALWSEDCQEWQARDSDGVLFTGDNPWRVRVAFMEERANIRENARKSGIPLEEECQQRHDAALAVVNV